MKPRPNTPKNTKRRLNSPSSGSRTRTAMHRMTNTVRKAMRMVALVLWTHAAKNAQRCPCSIKRNS